MLGKAHALKGYTLDSRDGRIGEVKDSPSMTHFPVSKDVTTHPETGPGFSTLTAADLYLLTKPALFEK